MRIHPKMRFSTLLAAGLLVLCQPGICQEIETENVRPAKVIIPQQVAGILDAAASAPPELSAHCLLRVVNSGQLKDAGLKIQLLEDAFLIAGRAQHPTPQALAVRPPFPTRSLLRAASSHLRLDRLSLQSEAVRAMLALDPRRAVEMFHRVELQVSSPSCQEVLVDDYSAYYRLASEVISRGFSAAEIRRGEHVAEARRLLSGIASPLQLAPAAALIRSSELMPAQRQEVTNYFAFALGQVAGGDRAFSFSVRVVHAAVQELVAALPEQGSIAVELRKRYRSYLARHLRRPRCSENVDRNSEHWKLESTILAGFTGADAFEDRDRLPQRVDEPARATPAFPHADEIVRRGKEIYTNRFSREEERTVEWKLRLDDFVRYIRDLPAAVQQSESELCLERASVLGEILPAAPAGPERNLLRRLAIQVLENCPYQFEDWTVWFSFAHQMLEGEDTEEALRAMEASRNPQLALLARLERTLPAKR